MAMKICLHITKRKKKGTNLDLPAKNKWKQKEFIKYIIIIACLDIKYSQVNSTVMFGTMLFTAGIFLFQYTRVY